MLQILDKNMLYLLNELISVISMKMLCKYSGEEFIPSRSNQKFATTKNRIKYHNEKLKKIRDARYPLDGKLHRNYKILLKLMNDKTHESFHKEYLVGKDFSFDVLTHYQLYKGQKRHAIYDFLIINKEEQILIIKY